MKNEKFDIYKEVTAHIIKAIEGGQAQCNRFWEHLIAFHCNYQGKTYQGINQLLLTAQGGNYARPQWITFKQAQELGGHIKKGEKSSLVVFASFFEDEYQKDENGNPLKIWYMKGHRVFNVAQTENLPDQFYYLPNTQKFADFDAIENFIAALGVQINHGGNDAYYHRTQDFIQMPMKSQFKTANDYYSVLLHEVTHWSGAPHRLARTKGEKRNDANYCREELCAEIGAAFLCSHFGLDATPREDHAAYLQHYLKLLKTDSKAIFAAAKAAQQATEWLLNHATPLAMAAE